MTTLAPTLELSRIVDRLEARHAAIEPHVLAFRSEPGRFERLRREALALERRHPDPAKRPPLYGCFVGVKDIIRVDGLPITGGSRLPPHLFAGSEAACVSALRSAGALIVGITVSTEFAYFTPGPTRNPRRLAHTPGGSSSGSAAAVAAGLCTFALGSQTVGSTLRPAAFCGVPAYKPTLGRISTRNVLPLAPTFDHVGCFAVTMSELARGVAQMVADWRASTSGARLPVLGIPEGPYLEQASADGLAAFRSDCARLAGAGYDLREVSALDDVPAIRARHLDLLAAEAAGTHARWFAAHGDLYSPRFRELVERGRTVDAQAIDAARRGARDLRRDLTALMDAHGLDAWVAPAATGSAPAGLEATGDPAMNVAWTHAGLPVVGLPSGTDAAGLPRALQVIGRWREDESLLAWAESLGRPLAPPDLGLDPALSA